MAKINNNNKSDDSLNTFSPRMINKKRLGGAKKEMEGFHISQEEFDSIPTFETKWKDVSLANTSFVLIIYLTFGQLRVLHTRKRHCNDLVSLIHQYDHTYVE